MCVFKKEVEFEVPLRDGFGDIAGGEILSRPEVSQNRGRSERKAEGKVEEEPGPRVSELESAQRTWETLREAVKVQRWICWGDAMTDGQTAQLRWVTEG